MPLVESVRQVPPCSLQKGGAQKKRDAANCCIAQDWIEK